MRTHRLIYIGDEEGFYSADKFSRFVLSDLAQRLNIDNLKINPEEVDDNYTIYHLPTLGTGIQYLKGEGEHTGLIQVGLLGRGSDVIGNIILEEARKS